MGGSLANLSEAESRATLAEMQLRLPDLRAAAAAQLQQLIADPKLETAIAHRALAWNALQKGDYETASSELNRALEADVKDIWTRYYLSAMKYQAARRHGQEIQGLANMLQDLKQVVEWYPDFAVAYNMLGMGRLDGGGITSAMEAEKAATLLAPRDDTFSLNMAKIYVSAKQWDAAGALLQHLESSDNPDTAKAAKEEIEALPTIRKYGIDPKAEARAASAPAAREQLHVAASTPVAAARQIQLR